MPTITDRLIEAQAREQETQIQMMASADYAKRNLDVYNKNMSLYYSMNRPGTQADLTPWKAAGFGDSKFDKRATSLYDYSDQTDLRASEQSWMGKLGNALVKTAVTTGTTFANMFSSAFVAPVMSWTTDYNYVNNPITASLMNVENWFEEHFPNYHSNWEQEAAWYQRMGTINFWADDVVKNLGFSMGSVGAAKLATKGLSALTRGMTKRAYVEGFRALGKQFSSKMAGSEIRNVMAEASKDLGQELAKRETIAKLSRISKAEDAIAGVSGSIMGAIGEAQYEAQNAYSDFVDENKARFDSWFNDNDAYIRRMYANAGGKDENGNPIDYETFKRLKYDTAVRDIEREGLRVGNSVFAYESALLSLTNYATFRRFFGGGYKNFNPTTTRSVVPGITQNEIAENIGQRVGKNGVKEAYNKLTRGKKAWLIGKNALTEGPVEEMGQNFINKASEFYHGSYLNEHLGIILNENYNDQAASAINSIAQGLASSYGDPEQWMDGFAGAIFGIAGVPGAKLNEKYKPKPTGEDTRTREEKRRLTINAIPFWNNEGSIRSEWKEIQDRSKLIDETVAKVNEVISDPKKRDIFEKAVINIGHETAMQDALNSQNKLEYKDSEFKQLMNIVSAFSNAGMSDVLDEMIDSVVADLSDKKIEEIREMLSDEEKQKPAEEIRKRISKEVADVKDLIKSYRDTRDDLAAIHGRNFTPQQLDLMAEMLSLSDYKKNRAKEIIKKYPELGFVVGSDFRAQVDHLISVLHFDTAEFDHFDNATDDMKRVAFNHAWEAFVKDSPSEWNDLKTETVLNDLVDAFINIRDAIGLNNEFAFLAAHPMTMSKQFAKMYNEHLTRREKKLVDGYVERLKGAETVDAVEKMLEEVDSTNEHIKKEVEKQAKNLNSEPINKYFKQKQQQKDYDSMMRYIGDTKSMMYGGFGTSPAYASHVQTRLLASSPAEYEQTLEDLYNNAQDDTERNFINHLKSIYSSVEMASAAPAEAKSDENKDFSERKDNLDKYLDSDIFGKLAKQYWKDAGYKGVIMKDGRFVSAVMLKTDTDKTLVLQYVNDIYYNQSYFEAYTVSNNNKSEVIGIPVNDSAYAPENHIAVSDYSEAVVDALQKLLPNSSAETITKLAQDLSNRAIYNPYNEGFAKKFNENSFEGFNELIGVTVNDNAPQEQTEEEKKAEQEKRNQEREEKAKRTISTIDSTIENKDKAAHDVLDAIDDMSADEKAQYNDLASIEATAKEVLEQNARIRGRLTKELRESTEHTDADIAIMQGILNDATAIQTIAMPAKRKETINNSKQQTIEPVVAKEYDGNNPLLLPVFEYDMPQGDTSDFEAGTMSRERTQSSPNRREANGINFDDILHNFLYSNNARANIFFLREGDEIHFTEIPETDKESLRAYYGDKLPYVARDKNDNIVGLVVIDGSATLWNKINKNPKTTVKVNEKWSYRSRFETRGENPLPLSEVDDGRENGIIAFRDSKGIVHLSQNDVQYYKEEYGLSNESIDMITRDRKMQSKDAGSPFIILDTGDHFVPHTNNGQQYLNLHTDTVSLRPSYEYPNVFNDIISGVESCFSNGVTPDAVNAANQIIGKSLATGKNVWSKLSIIHDAQTGAYKLFADIRNSEGEVSETIPLFPVDAEFTNNFKRLLTEKDFQDSFNIPGGIVVSVTEETMSKEGVPVGMGYFLNGNKLRSAMSTYYPSYVPYNVNAKLDVKAAEPTAPIQGTTPVGAQQHEQASQPTYTGTNKQSGDAFVDDIVDVRSTLSADPEFSKFGSLFSKEGFADAYNTFAANMCTVLTDPNTKDEAKRLTSYFRSRLAAMLKQNDNKGIFKYCFADVNNRYLMQQLKDC